MARFVVDEEEDIPEGPLKKKVEFLKTGIVMKTRKDKMRLAKFLLDL